MRVKKFCLANKEALVMAGGLFMEAVKASGALLLPVDSEHNAIFQCLPPTSRGLSGSGVLRLLLSASGGPFRGLTTEQMVDVTVEQAVAHPNWSMGQQDIGGFGHTHEQGAGVNRGLLVV